MDKINVLIPEEKVNARIKEVAEQISRDYAGRNIHLICILKGGVFFMCELAYRFPWILWPFPVTEMKQRV